MEKMKIEELKAKVRNRILDIKNFRKLDHDGIIKYLYKNPEKIEKGFKIIDKEFRVGKIFDILGRDRNNTLTIIEVKIDLRYTNLTAGLEKLTNYAKWLRYLAKILGVKKLPLKLILIRKTYVGIVKDVWFLPPHKEVGNI